MPPFSKKLQINLRTFTAQIASVFTIEGKDLKRTVGRPRCSISPKPPLGRNPAVPSPVANIRFVKVALWSKIDGNHSRYKKCNITCTVECSKRKVGLCLNKDSYFLIHFFQRIYDKQLYFFVIFTNLVRQCSTITTNYKFCN